ncbi:hypothetical protein C8R45DRAFT_422669 [Mycena sanguinolenta]|nr:hypothetical protein C8R45DRAFT_422669 [Mycena sanguinolenta]
MTIFPSSSDRQTVNNYITGGQGGSGGQGHGQGVGGAGGPGIGPSLNFQISGGAFFANDNFQRRDEKGIEILHRAAALEAIHDSAESYPQPRCHPETRTKMLEDLRTWALDLNPETTILWLYGPAGAGKSAIMQTLARQLQDIGRLGGSFIFQRGHTTRGNAKTLVATLAYQIALNVGSWQTPVSRMVENEPSIVKHSIASPRAPIAQMVENEPPFVEHSIVPLRTPIPLMLENDPSIVEQSIPPLRTSISRMVEDDPSIVGWSIAAQMQKLISEPCSARRHHDPVVIVIDGLDECEGHDIQVVILQAILTASSTLLRFMVASRPEPHICEMFDSPDYDGHYRSFNVEQSFEDVRKYLSDEFGRIHWEHCAMRSVPLPWPLPGVLDQLIRKSSGYFIYASTIVKFIDDINYRPTERLAIILDDGVGSESAFDGLDQLYMTILSSAPRQSQLIPIFCAIVNFDFNTSMLDLVLRLADGETRLLLRSLNSLLDVPSVDGDPISSYHASFPDFLNNPSRSQDFCVGTLHRRMDLARCLLAFCARQYQTEWLRLSGPRSLKHNLIPFIISLPPSTELCTLIGDMNPAYISALDFDKGSMVSWLKRIPSVPQDLLKVWEGHAHFPSFELHGGSSANDLPLHSSVATCVVADQSSNFLEEEDHRSSISSPNMPQEQGSSDPHISTFVIFMPDSVFHANDPTAVRREDAGFLEEFVADGGSWSSIHRSVEAENWVERNYNSTLLKSLRSVGLGGPIATMLCAEIPALAIFGSILDNRVCELAQTLSHLSALPVMIRPVADDPVMIFSQFTGSDAVLQGEPETDCETEDGSEWDGPSSESGTNDSDDEADLPAEGVFRPRGGATREGTADEILPKGMKRPIYGVHRTNIKLHLNLDQNCVYDVKVSSETMVSAIYWDLSSANFVPVQVSNRYR